ncbi:MAG TPA: hypothetical protein VGW30_07420 [Gaiellaceae bacterium]|nr:hypothetical protein [Gaiellaceae bacterium]
MSNGTRTALLVLFAGAMTAVSLSSGTDARAASERVQVSAVRQGVLIRVFSGRARAVDFTLGGRLLARRYRAPYSVVLAGHRPARRGVRGAKWIVARDRRSGRRLASVRVTVRRIARRPGISLTGSPARQTAGTEARFSFKSVRAQSTRCQLDSRTETRCGSPVVYRGLAPGRHLFTVRAIGAGGSASASYSWTVVPPPPPPVNVPVPSLPPLGGVAAPPTAPSAYAIPPGAVHVSTSAGLEQALDVGHPTDIVLADGVYDNAEPFQNAYGHRVYAARLGGALLRAGFVLGHNWGAGGGLLRGLAFSVSDPAKTLHGDIVHVWGTAKGTRLLDLTLDGHGVLSSGIAVRQVEGAVVQRIAVRNFRNWGVIVDANIRGLQVAQPPLVEDIFASDVTWPVRHSSGGHSEACVWIGNTAVVRRVLAVRCAWEGLWTGTAARGALLEDIRVDEATVGVYAEHFNSAGTTFRRLEVGPSVPTGVLCEWSDPAWGGVAGCIDVVIEHSLFDTSLIGVYLDEGTTRTTVRNSVFRNQSWAAVSDHKGIGNSSYANDTSRLRPGAVPLSHEHLFVYCGCGT